MSDVALVALAIGLIVCETAVCFTSIGGSLKTGLEDIFVAVLTEGTVLLALRSPMDFARLHGSVMFHWSLGLGTGLAGLGILLNHLAATRFPGRP